MNRDEQLLDAWLAMRTRLIHTKRDMLTWYSAMLLSAGVNPLNELVSKEYYRLYYRYRIQSLALNRIDSMQ